MFNLFIKTKKEPSARTSSNQIDRDNYNTKLELCQIYNYLLKNCVGYENRQKASQIMKIFNITDHKIFRNKIEEIRQSEEFGFICSEAGKNGGYWIPKTYEEVQKTLDHIFKRSSEMLRTYGILKRKVQKRGLTR